jgi:hypothetical protein
MKCQQCDQAATQHMELECLEAGQESHWLFLA